jgi:hypothetical protein
MTTLAVDAPMQKVQGFLGSIPIVANDIVYEGAMVGENGAGYGRPLTAGDKFVGHCITKVDNTLSGPLAKAGAAGDLNIRLMVGRYRLIVALVGVITDVGRPVYASDDATLTFVAPANSFVGVVTRYVSATQMEVEFRPGEEDEFGANPNRVTKSADYTVLATDNGKIIYVDTDTKIITMLATVAGFTVTIVNAAPAGTALIEVDVDNADKLLGGCGIAAANDGVKISNTKATAKRGDFIKLVGDGTNGWNIVDKRGTWA